MSIIDSGRYRLRKDWASVSIPSLVDIEEHGDGDSTPSQVAPEDLNATEPPLKPQKPPRRSSLALSLFSGKSDKNQKRRSSIASFLRRDQSKNTSKDSYESAVRQEKSDGSITLPSCDSEFGCSDNIRASSPKEADQATFFDDGSGALPAVKTLAGAASDAPVDKERNRRRRSSLQTKLERRRRKNNHHDVGQVSADSGLANGSQADLSNGGSSCELNCSDGDAENAAYLPRQKRLSWWNIFVPESVKSRSKSRSVDHGLATPFDLESLRSKVEGRFESVDRLSNERNKKSSLSSIPNVSYTVGNRDTLTSVAARFDTTPSELTHLNRLNSSFIYPGQQLLVPDKSAKDVASAASSGATDETTEGSSSSGKSSPVERKASTEEQNKERDILEGLRPGSPKPGRIERIDASSDAESNKSDDLIITQRFLKINVRHITDGQGVVGGVLLVTPNAVMFDPNVSDPLVIEHGPESYGVIAPMELVVNAAIFHDIAHMRVSGGVKDSSGQAEPAEIYYPKSVLEAKQSKDEKAASADAVDGQMSLTQEGSKQLSSLDAGDDQESLCSSSGREGDVLAKGNEGPSKVEATAKDSAKTDSMLNSAESKSTALGDGRSSLEERRKSLLDHHWAIPSKDRSSEDEGDNESNVTVDSGARGQEPHSSATSSISGVGVIASGVAAMDLEQLEQLSKQTCYDSGIDIRDPPLPQVQPIPKKAVYSDADIVLSSDWVPPKNISPTHLSESPPRSTILGLEVQPGAGGGGTRKKTSSVSFSVEDGETAAQAAASGADKGSEKRSKMLKRLSYPLTWVDGLTGEGAAAAGKSTDSDSAPNTGDSNQSVFSKVFSRRSSIGTFMRPHSSEGSSASSSKLQKEFKQQQQPKLDYRSMVSVDDKPELFISVDKLIPRPARACPDPPLYLRLRMGKPIGKTVPLPTSVMSYGKNKLRPEYWFSVPKNRVDELYRFMNTWVQHLYGELDEEHIKQRGFELIQDDTEWTKSGTKKAGQQSASLDGEDISDLTRESWEVLSMSNDEYRKASLFASGSFDLEFPIPDLIGTTEILTEEHREKLCGHLPARAEGYSWSLVFSTSQHGFSLNSLYRKMQRLESPVLIVIEDTDRNVFGALTSCSLHVSDHFYGTGESLLYKFNPSFKVFHWTGENLYFIKGNVESLSIGAGDGRFGLWLDGDLNQGRSQACSTYGNEALAPQEDFVIKTLECWAFV